MPVNVLFLHSGDSMRGSEIALLTLFRGLDRREVVPFLFTSNEELAEVAKTNGVIVTVNPMPEIMIDGSYVRLRLWLWAKTIQRLTSFIKRNAIHLLYCNGGSTCQVGYYVGKAKYIPVICHLHSPYNRRYILLYRLHKATKVIFVSNAIRNSILGKQEFQGECQVVYNGIDTGKFKPATERDPSWRERLSLPETAVVFGQVSSMISRKGIDILLRAFQIVIRSYPNARLVLVGDGEEKGKFFNSSNQMGLSSSVIWTGNQADTAPYYQHVFDINILASRSDAFPLSILEAAACSLPNIAANVGGIPESVIDGETGFLFERENHEMLGQKMSALIQYPDLRKRLGEAGRQAALQRFSMKRYCVDVQRIIVDQVKIGSKFSSTE